MTDLLDAIELLAEMRKELDNQSDVVDTSDGVAPNDAMQLEMLGATGYGTGWAVRVESLLKRHNFNWRIA